MAPLCRLRGDARPARFPKIKRRARTTLSPTIKLGAGIPGAMPDPVARAHPAWFRVNEMLSGLDWMPTLVVAAGDPDVKTKLLTGHQAGTETFKVHLDGYNQLPYLTGQTELSQAEILPQVLRADTERFAARANQGGQSCLRAWLDGLEVR